MTKDTHKHGATGQAQTIEQLERLGAAGGEFGEAMARSTQACLDGMTQFNGEIVEFVNDRLRRDADFGQSLARCGNWAEAASLQQDWARRTMQDYFSETAKLWQLASKATLVSMDPMMRTTARQMSGLMRPPAGAGKH